MPSPSAARAVPTAECRPAAAASIADTAADAGIDAAAAVAEPDAPLFPDVDLDVVYWATPAPVVDKMLEMAEVEASDVVYDLGCGDARILITAAKRFGARGFGFDLDPRRVSEARENARRNGVENLVTIEQADIFKLDLSPADVVLLFLLPKLNVRLMPQLRKLHRGARIVSHEFDMDGAKPVRVEQVAGPPDGPPVTFPHFNVITHTVYLWEVPWRRRAKKR